MAPKPQTTAVTSTGRGRSRTRSLTVENLRSSRHIQQSEEISNDLDEVVNDQPLPPQIEPRNVAQPPQDMDAEDSLGGVLESNANLAPSNEPVEMDPAVGENNDNEDQQSDMDLDYLAESESDSETENEVNEANNANNPDNGGQGGSGGQNEVFFSDEDTGESSHGEEDESEAGETDEQDGDEFSFGGQVGGPGPEELLERRSSGPLGGLGHDRANLAPQSMQWAIRPRTKTRTGGTSSGNGGLIYIEPAQLRRSTSSAVAAAAVASANGNGNSEAVTMYTTASALARAFSIVVRTISDLLSLLQDYGPLTPPLNRMLDISQNEAVSLQLMIEATLKLNWDWLMTVMDSTEAQLRFGSALTNATDPNQPGHPLSRSSTASRMASSSQDPPTSSRSLTGTRSGASLASFSAGTGTGSAAVLAAATGGHLDPRERREKEEREIRQDFLSYALSLMRSHNSEHSDSLPIIDVASMKHIAYVFDALIYYMRSGSELDLKTAPMEVVAQDLPNDDLDLETEANYEESHGGRRHIFFQRSESTLCLGCPPPGMLNFTIFFRSRLIF